MRELVRLTLGAAFACGAGIATAQGADDFILLDTLTLTASGEPVALSRTGASVTVLTGDGITSAGGLTFGNLMAQQPGIAFSASGGPGTTSGMRLRGLSSGYIGARIDGFDVTDTAGINFEFNFNTLGTGGLSRIEVLRGSQSALYGSEAIAGVIDVTTWRPVADGFSGMVRVETGTAATHTGEVAAGFLGDRVELAFSASRTVSDGGFSAWDGGVEDDGYDITTAAAYAAVQVTDALRLGGNLLWRESYGEYDNQFGFGELERGMYQDASQRGARVFAEFDTSTTHHEFAVSRLVNERTEVPGFSGAGHDDFNGTRNGLTYFGNWQASDALALNWGAEQTRESFDSADGAGAVRTRALHAEALWSPADTLDLSFALRHDEHGKFGGKATGRVAVAWRPADGWTLRAVAGTGFRAPSLYELYGAYGSEDLQPETSRSLEFGLEREFASGAVIQATLFDIQLQDRIRWDDSAIYCGSGFGCYNQVSGQSTSRGLELSGHMDLAHGWSLSGNYTYTDARDDGARAAKVPRHMATLAVEGPLLNERLTAAFSLRHVADTLESGTPLPDYTLVTTGFTYALDARTEATFRIENLFDQDYQTAFGYNQPGRQVFVGVRTSF